jgi:DNA-binding NarL/FixJ family response regulator
MSATSRPRILIADDHTLVAEAFKTFLATDFDVIATVQDGRTLVETALSLRPDVILTDIAMPLLNGLDAADRIKRALPDVKLIFVTLHRDPSLVAEAFRHRASGYLLKTSAASELMVAIGQALRGKTYLSPALGALLPELLAVEGVQPTRDKLTDGNRRPSTDRGGPVDKRDGGHAKTENRRLRFWAGSLRCLNPQNDAEIVQCAMQTRRVWLICTW